MEVLVLEPIAAHTTMAVLYSYTIPQYTCSATVALRVVTHLSHFTFTKYPGVTALSHAVKRQPI